MVGFGSPFLIYVVIFFLIILCLFWLAISIIKKFKIGKIISIILILLLTYPLFEDFYSSYTFKNNVKKDLKILNFELNDDFTIPVSFGDDNYLTGKSQTTTLKISSEDKLRLIDQISNSKNFKELKTENEIRIEHDKIYLPKYFFNYKYPKYYSRKINTKIDNKQVTIDLQIDLLSDQLEYSKWER